jgi:hypothetical protein
MVVAGGGEDLIAAAQHVLPHCLCRYVCVAWFGEIAVRGAANEAAFALRIKPTSGFSIWNYWGDRCARRLLLSSSAATTTTTTAARSVLRTLSAASPLVAPASSIVTVVAALAGVTLIAIALLLLAPFAATTTASFAALGLRIVRCLLLLLGRGAAVAAIGRAVGGDGFGIRGCIRRSGGIWRGRRNSW